MKDPVRIKYLVLKFFKYFFGVTGIFAFLFFILSFTDIPYYAYHWLGTSNAGSTDKPDVIVLLGGSGMPSPDGLIRAYYTVEAAKEFPKAKIVIALPFGEEDSLRQLNLMANELIVKGIDSARITYEGLGFNTHSQAEQIAKKYSHSLKILLITSPEHMYRSVRTFLKVGFTCVYGSSTFEEPVEEEKVTDRENTKDTRVKSLSLRYNMWSYMNYELLVLKEYCAICYYKLKGWI